MAEELACNNPLMNVSLPRQWLGRGETAAVGYQSVGPMSKYRGGWKPPTGYLPYVPKNQAEYGHHLVVIPYNEVHGQVGQLHPRKPGVGKHMAEREQKAEIFCAHNPERYTRGANTELHHTIVGIMQNYNKNFSELRISNVCNLAGLKVY